MLSVQNVQRSIIFVRTSLCIRLFIFLSLFCPGLLIISDSGQLFDLFNISPQALSCDRKRFLK